MTSTATEIRWKRSNAPAARRFYRIAAGTCWFFAVVCLPYAAVVWAISSHAMALVFLGAALFWLLLGFTAWWFGRRSKLARRNFDAGRVALAVRGHGVAVSPSVVVGFVEIESIHLDWFEIRPGAPAIHAGSKIADSLVESAMDQSGGNVGLALTAVLRDPAGTKAHAVRTDPQTERLFTSSPDERAVLVVKVHRLLCEGDFAGFVPALQQAAAYHRIPVTVTNSLPGPAWG